MNTNFVFELIIGFFVILFIIVLLIIDIKRIKKRINTGQKEGWEYRSISRKKSIILLGIGFEYLCMYIILNTLYIQSNKLIFHFITILWATITFPLLIIVISFSIYRIKKDIYKWFEIIITIFMLFFVNYLSFRVLPLQNTYVNIDGKKLSRYSYNYEMLKDVINQQTEKTTLKACDIITVNVRGDFYVCYTVLKENNKSYQYSSDYSIDIIKLINDLQSLEDEIVIEYYVNSGVIKSIDGFDLNKLVEKVENLKIKDSSKNTKEQQELRSTISVKDEIIQNAVGKKIENVKNELQMNLINDYSIKYISSKLGGIHDVIFVDKNDFCFYVIGDDNHEEMTQMPNLKQGLKKNEVIKILEKKGLNYKFYQGGYTNDKTKIDTLCSYTYVPGTLIPKGLEVEIGLYRYNNNQ